MSAPAFALVNGLPVAKMSLHVPARGAWFVSLDNEDDSGTINGGDACALALAGSTLVCRAMPSFTGTFALQRKVALVAGAGAWGSQVEPKPYHNDAGIPASQAAADIAAEIGETLGALTPERAILGVDYARKAGLASRALEEVIGNVPWYVDYAGVTQFGARAGITADPGAYEVLEYNPRTHVALLAVDDLSIGVGSVISARLDVQETIQSFDLMLDGKQLRMTANCGIALDSTTQIETLVRRIIERATDSRLLGPYRYRVVSMNSDNRVNLQAVSARAGVPDMLLVEQWPGVAGADAVLTSGSLVLVEFADGGDPTLPVVTHYRGRQDTSFIPVSLAFCGGTRAAMGQGDLVQSGGPGTIVTLLPVTGVGAPPNNAVVAGVPHYISFSATPPTPVLADPLYGAGMTGAQKVLVP